MKRAQELLKLASESLNKFEWNYALEYGYESLADVFTIKS